VKRASDILPQIYRRRPGAHDDRDLLLSYWSAAVGPQVAAQAHPVRLVNKRLRVEVESAAWLQQLLPLTGEIIRKLNKLMTRQAVEAIDFRATRTPARPPQRAATATASAHIADEAAAIQDPFLRRLYRVSKRRALQADRNRRPSA
jgi:hypothetical protein